MSDEIKVSVIVPVYNAQDSLIESIGSITKQSLESIEIICIDDGSTDNSFQILQQLSENDNRIIAVRQDNLHAGVARNHGLRLARGKYVTFLDADDCYYSDNVLDTMYNKAHSANADMIKGRFVYRDCTNRRVFSDYYSKSSAVSPLMRRNAFSFSEYPERLVNTADVPWNGLYLRSFLEKNGIVFNDLICVNDHSFYINCLLCAERIVFSAEKMVYYRIGSGFSLVDVKPQHFSAQLGSYEIIHSMCSNQPKRIRNAIMRQELCGVFGLYEKIHDNDSVEKQMICFLKKVDETDFGEDFLEQFSFARSYYRLRYGIETKRKTKGVLSSIKQCFREHGLGYTLKKLWF